MNERERRAFNREVYGPEGRSQKEVQARSQRATAARELAQSLKLPQRIVDRAASYAADGDRTAEQAVEAAIVADPEYTPTLRQALRNPDAFVDGMTEA